MRQITDRVLAILMHPAAVAVAGLGYFAAIHQLDTRWRFIPYLLTVTLASAAILFLLSRRPVFSLYASATVILAISAASFVKYRLKGLALHVYDLVFTGSDTSALLFLVNSYRSLFVSALMVLAVLIVFLALLFRAERPLSMRWTHRSGLMSSCVVLPVLAYPPDRVEEPDFLPFISGYNASAFWVSLGHVSIPIGRIRIADHVDSVSSTAAFADTVDCGTGNKPDLFMVLAETQTEPKIFPQVTVPEALQDSFASGDGKIHPLYVETFGGGTWVTNFSVMTGLSTADFGWQAPYVTQLMEGRVRGALPEVLARCGYRTVTVMPMMYNFVNEGPLLKSIGFQEIYDAAAMGVEPLATRDSVYLDFAEKLIAEHRRTDRRPLFVAIQTLFAHSPYDHPHVDDSELPPTAYSADPKANEYFRRVTMARADFATFLNRRKAEPGPSGSVVADFGDHQGEATRDFAFELSGGPQAFADFRSILYRTYFGIHAFGTPIDYTRFAESEDVPFLTARLLQSANLPTSPLFRDLVRLSDLCKGRFHTCQQRAEIDLHLKKRVNAGLLRID